VLSPLRRAIFGVPYLYQKVTSTSPVTVTIGTNTTSSSFATVYLDGRVDWMVAQRNALLCYTGHNLILEPKLNIQMVGMLFKLSVLANPARMSLIGVTLTSLDEAY
jgi:hypothetical protein